MNAAFWRLNVHILTFLDHTTRRCAGSVADREQRLDRVCDMLRGSPNRRSSAFAAGMECDGVIPVTIARWSSEDSADVIDSWEMCFTAASWDPMWLRNELDQLDHEEAP